MNKIKILSDRIIIDGHADTKEQCETATMLANLLSAQGSGFNCVEYRNGYAEFKKSDVVKLADSELKFPPASWTITFVWDGNIESVVLSNSSESHTYTASGSSFTLSYGTTYTITVNCASGYVLDTISGVDYTDKTNNSFVIDATGKLGEQSTITITSKSAAFDGKINITKSAGVVLKTQGKYCAEDITVVPTLEEKSVTPTESAQEITPSAGNCGISKVTVGAVQTETKTVAPSASAQTYSPSSGKYFANFTVSAVPSQSKTVTPTKSVQTVNADSGKWLSSVTVNAIPDEFIQPSGSQDITANGTYDVTEKASVNVNVPTASAVEEVATASAMDALLVEANVGKYYKFTGTTDSNYTNGDLYLVEGGGNTN